MKGKVLRNRRASISSEVITPISNLQEECKVKTYISDVNLKKLTQFLKASFLFKDLNPDQQKLFCQLMYPLNYEAGEVITRWGYSCQYFFFLCQGSCARVLPNDLKKIEQTFKPGYFFGEEFLMYHADAKQTTLALEPCQFLCIDRLRFRTVLQNVEAERKRYLEDMIMQSMLKSHLLPGEEKKIVDAIKEREYMPGDFIIKQGESFSKQMEFFILLKGVVEVFVLSKSTNELVKTDQLSSGEIFGHSALMQKGPRNATLKCLSKVSCAYLKFDAFERLLGSKLFEVEAYKKINDEALMMHEVKNASKQLKSRTVKTQTDVNQVSKNVSCATQTSTNQSNDMEVEDNGSVSASTKKNFWSLLLLSLATGGCLLVYKTKGQLCVKPYTLQRLPSIKFDID